MTCWARWYLRPGRVGSCAECRDTWSGKPPCGECSKPRGMHPGIEIPWRAWRLCHEAGSGRDGMSGRLRIEAVLAVLAAMDGDADDIDLVLLVERIYQEIVAEVKKSMEDNNEQQGIP